MKKISFKHHLPKASRLAGSLKNYYSIDLPLQSYFTKSLLRYFIMLWALIIYCIVFRQPKLFLAGSIALLILIGITLFRIQKCLEDSVCKLEGICDEIYTPSKLKKLMDKQIFARDYLILRTTDDQYVKVYNVRRFKIREDNSLIIYFPKDNIRTINDDTYQLLTFYWIYVAQRKSKKTQKQK